MLEKRLAALSRALGNPRTPVAALPPEPVDAQSPTGYLVVRASGATAARLAIETAPVGDRSDSAPRQLQLLMRMPLPRYLPSAGASIDLADCALRAHPGDAGGRQGSALLTVSTAKLSIDYPQLRPLLFQPVPVPRPLQALFASSVAHVLVVADSLDPHGLRPYLTGLAELVLRSALRSELDRADAIATRAGRPPPTTSAPTWPIRRSAPNASPTRSTSPAAASTSCSTTARGCPGGSGSCAWRRPRSCSATRRTLPRASARCPGSAVSPTRRTSPGRFARWWGRPRATTATACSARRAVDLAPGRRSRPSTPADPAAPPAPASPGR